MKATQARVLLTGSGGGIGRAVAEALVSNGASVMLVGRSPARLATHARELLNANVMAQERVEWHAADLSQATGIAGLAEVATGWDCNVIVHGAGVPGFGRIETFDAARMAEVLQLNLLAPMLLTQALLPHLCGLPQTNVICIGSVLGRLGLPGFSVYSASKFGLRGFAESLRRELADTGVRVQYLGPRSTRTGFNNEDVRRYNQTTGTAMDAPGVVAQALLKLLESGDGEAFLGFPEKWAVRLNGMAPALLDPAFARHRASLPPRAAPAIVGPAGSGIGLSTLTKESL